MNEETKKVRQSADEPVATQELAEAFQLVGLKDDDYPPYSNARDFARGFQRCDRLEYVHTRYGATSLVED